MTKTRLPPTTLADSPGAVGLHLDNQAWLQELSAEQLASVNGGVMKMDDEKFGPKVPCTWIVPTMGTDGRVSGQQVDGTNYGPGH
jgi:hypothetical protein